MDLRATKIYFVFFHDQCRDIHDAVAIRIRLQYHGIKDNDCQDDWLQKKQKTPLQMSFAHHQTVLIRCSPALYNILKPYGLPPRRSEL